MGKVERAGLVFGQAGGEKVDREMNDDDDDDRKEEDENK